MPKTLRVPIDLDRAAGHVPNAFCMAMYPNVAAKYSRNPHGLTCYAEECRRALNMAERRILELVGTSPEEAFVIWCPNGTTALNLALRGIELPDASPLAIDIGGHHALVNTARSLGREVDGFLLDDGGAIAQRLPSECALVGLSMVNNETGVVWNGARDAMPSKAVLLVDACQCFGKHPIPWNLAHIDLLVLSGRKIGAPASSACLVCRKGVPLKTALVVGGGQQRGLLSGTVDTVNALLFAAVAEEACGNMDAALERVGALNKRLREGLVRLGCGKWPFFSPESASPYILYFAIPNYQGALVARLLAAEHGILVGTGSACTAESNETSALLKAKGVPDAQARSAIRVSLSPESTADDIDALLAALPQVLKDY
ncbi:MAG: aminotransferase class V-fold PLP-dependent enzyme [Lentisphaeria bacterium]|nr:aminotransferase class V-fold PLP-dependent enzyme [Lentisphaeria bacterium]